MTTDIITERNKTHGDFDENARVAQSFKDIMRGAAGWSYTTLAQRQALDEIATKISRIVSGRMFFADHWIDIEGYAALGRGVQPKKENEDGLGTAQASRNNMDRRERRQNRRVKRQRSRA